MKKVYLCGLSLLVASLGLSQGAVAATTTIVVGNCQITGVTGINHDYNSNVVTVNGGTLGSGCTAGGGGGGGGSTTSYVSVTPASLSYTLGTTLSSPMAISWTSSDQGVTCSINNQTGLVTNPTAGNSWSLTTPTTAGTYNFPITCSSNTTGITSTVVSPSSVALTVSNTPPPPPPSSGCSSTQLSTPWNLTRQCTGTVSYQWGAPIGGITFTSANPLQKLDDVMGGGTWLNYLGESWAWYVPVTSGSYISMAFTPTRNDVALNLNANPTYGDGGVISISTQPGVFDVNAGAICVYANNGSNNLAIGGYGCAVTVGQTYYINIADVTTTGSPHCYGTKPWNPQTCASSMVSYTAN